MKNNQLQTLLNKNIKKKIIQKTILLLLISTTSSCATNNIRDRKIMRALSKQNNILNIIEKNSSKIKESDFKKSLKSIKASNKMLIKLVKGENNGN